MSVVHPRRKSCTHLTKIRTSHRPFSTFYRYSDLPIFMFLHRIRATESLRPFTVYDYALPISKPLLTPHSRRNFFAMDRSSGIVFPPPRLCSRIVNKFVSQFDVEIATWPFYKRLGDFDFVTWKRELPYKMLMKTINVAFAETKGHNGREARRVINWIFQRWRSGTDKNDQQLETEY